MPRVVKRPLAHSDLAEIWSFIADDSEAAADRFLRAMEQKFRLLSTQPKLGRLRSELMAELRSFPVGRYVAFYLSMADGIELLRVLHGARDIGVHDFEDDDNA